MRVTVVAALGRNRVIGTDAGLPWHLPRELRQFRALTTGKPVVYGRKTHAHIGRPLPDRANIVLTRQPDFTAEGVRAVHSVEEALAVARQQAERLGAAEVMVIGGADVYRAFLTLTDRLCLTVVDGHFEGTVFFPVEDLGPAAWAVTDRREYPADAKNPHAYTFWQLDRAAEGTPGAIPADQLPALLGLV